MFRSVAIGAIAASCLLGPAYAAPEATASSPALASTPGLSAATPDAALSAYRTYVKAQADSLVGMTKVLARAIEHGDLDTAQMTYAPAHRYFKRIEAVARVFRDLDKRMDARADAYAMKESDPDFAGFHRIEYGLFANRSTQGLSSYAARLNGDAGALRERIARLDVTPADLIEGTARTLQAIADRGAVEEEESYSKTELWNVEANIEGARQIAAMLELRMRAQSDKSPAPVAIRFAEIDALLEKHKAGCGFVGYDALRRDDRLALKAPIATLAEAFATLHGTLAVK